MGGMPKVAMVREGLLFVAITTTFILIGYVVGYFMGDTGSMMLFALVMAVAMNGIAYLYGDKLVLKMTGARLVSEQEAPQLHTIVERLAARANMPKPKVGIVKTLSPNAFATPKNSVVCVPTDVSQLVTAFPSDFGRRAWRTRVA